MKVVSSLPDAANALAGRACVLSIGNFDGLHVGHQTILQKVVQRAHEFGVAAVALTFEPHPIQVLAPHKAPRRISTPNQKAALIGSTGIDLLFALPFDVEFSRLSPDDFIRDYLVDGLHARAICVGSDFSFGHRQSGSIDTLRHWPGLELIEVPPVMVQEIPASSTQVRKAVQEGNVALAARFLGRWFEIEGRIVSGAGRGRNVTVPTLNLDTDNELLPQRGVYVTRIALDGDPGGPYLDAVTNIGIRPTFEDAGEATIETFVLRGAVPADVSGARLQFLKHIRDEKRFDSPALLAEQIQRDVQTAENFFNVQTLASS